MYGRAFPSITSQQLEVLVRRNIPTLCAKNGPEHLQQIIKANSWIGMLDYRALRLALN
jgi:hypothetical protein